MYQIQIRGAGGVFTAYGDWQRVVHEVRNLPDGWGIKVYDMTDPDNPVLVDVSDIVWKG